MGTFLSENAERVMFIVVSGFVPYKRALKKVTSIVGTFLSDDSDADEKVTAKNY